MDNEFSSPRNNFFRQKHICAFFASFIIAFFAIFIIHLQLFGAKSIIQTIGLSPEKIQTCGVVLIKTENSTSVQVGVVFDVETKNEFLKYLKTTQCTIAEESPFTPVSDYRYYVYFEKGNGKTVTVFFTNNGYMSFDGSSYKLDMPDGENLMDFLSKYV